MSTQDLLQQITSLTQQMTTAVAELSTQLSTNNATADASPAITTNPAFSPHPTAAYQILTCQMIDGTLTPVWASLATLEAAIKLTTLPDYTIPATLINCHLDSAGGVINNSHAQPIDGTTVTGFTAQIYSPVSSQPVVFFMPDTPPDIYISQTADITQILAPMAGAVSRDPLIKLSFDLRANTLIFAGQTYPFAANVTDRIELTLDRQMVTITNTTTGDSSFSTSISSYMDFSKQCVYTFYLADSNPAFVANFCLLK